MGADPGPGGRPRPPSTPGPSLLPLSSPSTALENAEGPPPPGGQAAEDLQQEINAQSLEKVQQYYRKLRYLSGLPVGDRSPDTAWGVGMSIVDTGWVPSVGGDKMPFPFLHLLCAGSSVHASSADSHNSHGQPPNPLYRRGD